MTDITLHLGSKSRKALISVLSEWLDLNDISHYDEEERNLIEALLEEIQ